MEIDGKKELLHGTARHCVDPIMYQRGNIHEHDAIVARSFTRLHPEGSGITFETTDNPQALQRSHFYGMGLDGIQVTMHGCLPDGINKNMSTCFQVTGRSYMNEGKNGKGTVYMDRNEYLDLLRRGKRSCNDSSISGTSGNAIKDENGNVVGFLSTSIEACRILDLERKYNSKGLPLYVNALPMTYEPVRGSNGKTLVHLN